ncbi:MAG: TRAP transporter small permease [Boseongicola sp.]
MAEQTPQWLTAAESAVSRLSTLFAFAGALGIVTLLGVTVTAVFWRYALNAPIFGIEDVSIVALTIVAAASVAYGGLRHAHVSINLITRIAGRQTTRVTDAVTRVLTAAICFLATYALVVKACGMAKACITSNLSIEHRPFYYVLAVGMALVGLQITVRLLIGLANWHNEDPNEARD